MDAGRLVEVLRCSLAGEQPPPVGAGGARLAERHRVSGLLYHIGAAMGEADGRAAEAAWGRNVAGHLARQAAMGRVWPEGGPAPLLIKGADLAENLYDDPGARAANDVDALVPEPGFSAVAGALPREGRRPAPRYERYAREVPCAVGVVVDGVLIELHREVVPAHRARLSAAAMWSRGQAGAWGALDVRWPTPLDRLLVWLANAASDGFFLDLAGLYDLALVLRGLGGLDERPDWLGWRRHATAAGLRNPFDLALYRLSASGLWPGRLPVEARPAVRWADALLPPVLAGRVEPGRGRFQALKVWLCDGGRRVGVVWRGVATLARGGRPGP